MFVFPDGSGLEAFRQIKELDARIPVVLMTASGTSSVAIEAMQLGALDYLSKPLVVEQITELFDRGCQIRQLMTEPVRMDPSEPQCDDDLILGNCPPMQTVYKAIGRVASQDIPVLIRGESGTGKELVARAIYQFSRRSRGPFLAVNCAAIPEALLETSYSVTNGARLQVLTEPGSGNSNSATTVRFSLTKLATWLRSYRANCCGYFKTRPLNASVEIRRSTPMLGLSRQPTEIWNPW